MSSVRSKLSSLTGHGSPDREAEIEADKYKLLVTAGPSYDQSQHQVVQVNRGIATYIENEFVSAKIQVRIRSFRGLPSSSPTESTYFSDPTHEKDQYSIAFSFVPKKDLPSVDTVWGNDFDHSIRDRIPPGFNTAFRIVKEFIDPGLTCDAYADKPWLYGPSLSCWFIFRVGDKLHAEKGFPAPAEDKAMLEGGEGSGSSVREKLNIPANNEKRRKFFLSAEHRQDFTFEKGRLYQGDFYNPYLDFSNIALKLPGFSLKVVKYVDHKSHCLRYVFKNRATGEVYFNINIHLLWGEKLRQAIQIDQQQRKREDEGQEPDYSGILSLVDPSAASKYQGDHVPADSSDENEDDKQNGARPGGAGVEVTDPEQEKQARKDLQPRPGNAPPEQDQVSNITNMLLNTSTSDKRDQNIRILDDGVD